MRKILSYALLAAGTAAIVALDQFTKHAVAANFGLYEGFPLIGGVLSVTLVPPNPGAAWGLFKGGKWIFLAFTAVVLALLVVVYSRLKNKASHRWLRAALIMICGGALGNAVDRALNGEVIDFFELKLFDFPIFNVADVFICCGAGLALILFMFFIKEGEIFASRNGKSDRNGT